MKIIKVERLGVIRVRVHFDEPLPGNNASYMDVYDIQAESDNVKMLAECLQEQIYV